MALTKARILLLDTVPAIPSGQIDVQFNPNEYSLNKDAKISEIAIPGIDSPILQFVRGGNEKLTLELFFDTTEDEMGEGSTDVTTLTRQIYQLVKIQPSTHAAPRIRFVWGALKFKAIVENVQQKFTLFNPQGVPLRATVSVSFREYKTLDEQLRELNLQSADHTRTVKIRRGDTLSGIAAREYGDPTLWRHIADANQLTNARIIEQTELLIPALDVFSQPLVELLS